MSSVQKKIAFVKLKDNMNIDRKVDNLNNMIKELVENIDIDEYFMSFELTLLIINFIENDFCKKKYDNMNKINAINTIIETMFKKKLNDESLNERQKHKILSDIEHIYKNKMYTHFSYAYVYFIFFFFT